MGFYNVTITVEITEIQVEASSQEEADQLVIDDVSTRFPANFTIEEHTC